ncbi:hypothetical protein [Agromyces sp. SYSU T00194]|uniref:hypothetical protein n=1 Tax=Agromyces chitinivorans TaxID=3158560 RepID=UPI00339632BB
MEDANPEPFVFDGPDEHPYFPDRTISLAQDEEVVIVIALEPGYTDDPAEVRSCEVELAFRVLSDGLEAIVPIPVTVRTIGIEPDEADALYDVAYLGPEICESLTVAEIGWQTRPLECDRPY